MKLIDSLDAIAPDYDAVLCDIWGVIHNGRTAYQSACAALTRFRAQGGHVVLISNVPKPRDPIPGQLDRIGAPRSAWDAIVTSGDAIRAELAPRAPGPMYKIGPEGDAVLWKGLGLERTEKLDNAAFVAVSGLNDDTIETPEDYGALLDEAQARGLDLYCANPDIVVQRGDRLFWCAGALARDFEELGGRVVMAGKPFGPIYDLAYAELKRLADRPIEKSRILAIGDGLGTDVKGAQRQGLDCLFIAHGVHGAEVRGASGLDLDKALTAFEREGLVARYAMDALA